MRKKKKEKEEGGWPPHDKQEKNKIEAFWPLEVAELPS
jgi:hypothetical protein